MTKMLVMRQKLIDQAEYDTAPSQPVSQRRASGEPCIHSPFARHRGESMHGSPFARRLSAAA
jgi:hypothetical protein